MEGKYSRFRYNAKQTQFHVAEHAQYRPNHDVTSG